MLQPIFHDGLLYVSSGYGVGCNLFKILQVDGTNGFADIPMSGLCAGLALHRAMEDLLAQCAETGLISRPNIGMSGVYALVVCTARNHGSLRPNFVARADPRPMIEAVIQTTPPTTGIILTMPNTRSPRTTIARSPFR